MEPLSKRSAKSVYVMVCVLAFALAANAAPLASRLFTNHRTLLALARARGQKDVMLIMAALPGRNAALAGAIESLGGRIRYRDDDLDYLRAFLPIDNVEKAAVLPDLLSLDIDVSAMGTKGFYPEDEFPLPKEAPPSVPPDPDTPYSHPYIASRDMDTAGFWAAHPTFDGRGAGLAILDATPDILHSEFSSATSLQGEPIRKIPEILAVDDPIDDNDPMWVKMDTQVHVANGHFTYKGESYTAPADGDFRFGFFNERALIEPAYLYKDVNFDGNPPGSSGLFAVLWDEKSGTVWVDTNQNHSFNDEKAMQEYSRRFDVGTFGHGAPPSGPRKTVAFVVNPDPKDNYVRITLCVWQHITEVSGAAVGKGFYGGSYNGVAPEARLVPVYYPGGINRIIEAAIAAAKSKNVDVICLEPNILQPTINPLHDGRSVPAVIFDRIIEKYKKPILSPANNFSGVTTVLDYLSSGRVMAVGAYQSADSYRINNGATVRHKDNLHLVGSYGPAGDGGLKPDFISPSEIISTDSGFKPPERLKGVYELPPGYAIAGGTSTAGPTASAATTLLVSAAKQSGIKYDADRLRLALISGARFIPDIPAYKQGNGLVQVGASWEILKELDKKYEPLDISSLAPVHTANSALLKIPNKGRGIFEREGWSAGQSGERTIVFTRKAGPDEPILFNLQWVGNDGTFTSPDTVTLPLNQPVNLTVKVAVSTSGVHSAILNLRRPGYPGISYQTLNTVIAADQFTAASGYTIVEKGETPRPGTTSFFINVPPHTPALSLDLAIPNAKPTLRVYALDPGRSARLLFDYVGATEKGHLTKVIPKPEAGVWEILMWGNNFVFHPEEIDSSPLSSVPVTLKASLLGVDVSPAEVRVAQKTGVSEQEITFTNKLAPFQGRAFTVPFAAARRLSLTLEAGQQQLYDLKVAPGTQMLRVGISTSAESDVNLYLFRGIGGEQYLQKFDDQAGGSKALVIDNPPPGDWKVVVDAVHAPAHGVHLTYEDAIAHPVFGQITVEDSSGLKATGAVWKAKAEFKVAAMPADGRVLVGYIPVCPVSSEEEQKSATAGASETPAKPSLDPVAYAKVVVVGKATMASASSGTLTAQVAGGKQN